MRNVHVCLTLILMLIIQACRVDAQESTAPYAVSLPDRREHCIQVLEFERLRINPANGNVTFYPQDAQLAMDYTAVVSWLEGFLAGRQVNNPYHGPQVATWLLSYCRANPAKSLLDAAIQLAASLNH
jgi:hypothetical protein